MEITEQFLAKFPDHLIMILDDKSCKEAEPLRDPMLWHAGVYKNITNEVEELNKVGAGVFFTPNQYPGGSRQAKDCKGVNAWYMEIDDIPKPEQIQRIKAAPIAPSVIVETGKSYHCYWMAENGTIENFKKIAKGLVAHFDSDPAVADIARILRVPGYKHNKKEPVDVKLISINAATQTEQDMMEAYPYTEKVYKPKKQKFMAGDDIWDVMTNWDNVAMLDKLSGDSIVNGEHFTFKPRGGSGGFHIHVNGAPANAWIDGDGSIGGPCAPTWVQWLNNSTYYNVSKSDILKWTKENCQGFLPAKFFPEKKNKLREERIAEITPKTTNNSVFQSWGGVKDRVIRELLTLDPESLCKYHIKAVDNHMGAIFPSELIVVGADEGLGKSDFCLQIVKKNARHGKKVLYYQLEMSEEEPAYRDVYSELNKRLGEFTISPVDFRMNRFTDPQKQIVEEVLEEQDSMNENVLLYTGAVLDFDGFIKSLEEGLASNPDMIVIDHLHYFSMEGNENMSSQIGNIMRSLKRITKEHKVPIIVVSHFRKRDVTKEPTSADLFGSSNIAKEANTVFFITRDREDNDTTLTAWKRRVGGKKIDFNLHYNTTVGEYEFGESGIKLNRIF